MDMSFLPYLRMNFSLKGIMGTSFLPLVLSALIPYFKWREKVVSEMVDQPLPRYNWSHLTPLTLKNRCEGLGITSTGEQDAHFTLEGHKFLIFGGSIHYFRVPREYWRDRLLKLKACGFNTLTTYIPWNLHEPERGQFDFSGNLDLTAFVLMAEEVGLWVILRPGPYICSEVDLGGLPSWLLQDPILQLRTTNKNFTEAVDKYFDRLIPIMVPLQYHHGGPVIAVQVENEYGAYYKDKEYMPYIKEALVKRGIMEMLLTSDSKGEVAKGSIKGVLATINLNKLEDDSFDELYQVQGNKPILVMEFWVGWFESWGKKYPLKNFDMKKTFSQFIRRSISFNTYMFHGGTNFGFMGGATYLETYRGVVTSYDYNAVLTEAGDYTEKYSQLQKLLGSISEIPLPPPPPITPKTKYPSVKPFLYLPLWDALQYLNEPVKSQIPVNMENLPINNGSGQSFGLVLYETFICSGGLLFAQAEDMAQVFLNEIMIGVLNKENKYLTIPEFMDCILLRILVENQGRVSFSREIENQRKGLVGFVQINNVSLGDFTIYSLEMKKSFFKRIRSATWKPVPRNYVGPAFYHGILSVGPSPMDTFLSLPDWNYGFVFINGHNLGRYWKIGPQKTLYLPGAWLHPEDNEIILFEKMRSGSFIKFTKFPKL